MSGNNDPPQPLCILLVAYEFTYSPFSGNGILARSLVKSLLQQQCKVTVWCCRPENSACYAANHHLCFPEISQEEADHLVIIPTIIPEHLGWQRIDRECAWQHFSWKHVKQEVLLEKAASTADVVCVIDWTGSMAWQSCPLRNTKPILYLNFRVFSLGIKDSSEHEWYQTKEQDALEAASFVVALSEKDKQALCQLMKDDSDVPVEVLLPPLRGDMEELALKDPKDLQQYLPTRVSEALSSRLDRCLVTCVARLSPEKHVENFVKFIKANLTTLDDNAWIPFLAGSDSDKEYASNMKESLREVAPHSIIINSFLSPQSLAAVFTRTVLNFHPCEYDAYGMTVIEAATFGVPSIVQDNGHVGASVIVGNGASIEVDMSEGYCWESVTAVLNDKERTQQIGAEARKRALAWDEAAYGKQLLEYIHKLCSDR